MASGFTVKVLLDSCTIGYFRLVISLSDVLGWDRFLAFLILMGCLISPLKVQLVLFWLLSVSMAVSYVHFSYLALLTIPA